MSDLTRLYQGRSFQSDGRFFVVAVEQSGDQWFIVQHPSPFHEQNFPPSQMGAPFRWEETAVAAANRFAITGEMPERTKFSVRQLASGEWLVFNAISAKYGIGVYKVGSPAPGYTTGAQYGRHDTEVEALAHAHRLAYEHDGVVVEWQHPAKNPQFSDLPRQYPERTDYATFAEAEVDGWIYISPSKTIEHYRGAVIFARDVTPGMASGYELALTVRFDGQNHPREFARNQVVWGGGKFSYRFRTGDVVDGIRAARKYIDGLVD